MNQRPLPESHRLPLSLIRPVKHSAAICISQRSIFSVNVAKKKTCVGLKNSSVMPPLQGCESYEIFNGLRKPAHDSNDCLVLNRSSRLLSYQSRLLGGSRNGLFCAGQVPERSHTNCRVSVIVCWTPCVLRVFPEFQFRCRRSSRLEFPKGRMFVRSAEREREKVFWKKLRIFPSVAHRRKMVREGNRKEGKRKRNEKWETKQWVLKGKKLAASG